MLPKIDVMEGEQLPKAQFLFNDPSVRVSIPKSHRSDVSVNDSHVKLPRLMQRVGAEPGRPPNTASWFEDTNSTYKHHAAYLNRLRKLRQELIDHEHQKLTKALERFQVRDSDNTFYLNQRLPGRAVVKLHAHKALPVRSYSNVSERFRRGRRKEEPRLETIQGKQLLEPQIEPEDIPPAESTWEDRQEIDLTVKENLKRLLQPKPSCSIPTIGRRNFQNKYYSQKDSSSDSANTSPRGLWVKRSQTHHKFPLATGLKNSKKNLIRPDSDQLDLSPATFKFERLSKAGLYSRKMHSRDQRFYNVFYLATSPETSRTSPDFHEWPKLCTTSSDERSEQQTKRKPLEHHNTTPVLAPVSRAEPKEPRRIVVDMPDIILYPATPDVNLNVVEKGGQLSKTLKQNQLREREISNLLEDVKEISNRTETLENNFTSRGS